jgi:hypothetical protein
MRWNFDEEVMREGTDCIKYDLRGMVFGEVWSSEEHQAFFVEKAGVAAAVAGIR